MLARVSGFLIFWVAGMVVAYFLMREEEKSHWQNLKDIRWFLPINGAAVGALIMAVAYYTTGPDRVDDYW